MDVLNRLNDFIKQHALFMPGERILLAVSGGRDSVLMAHLFNDAGYDFGIAHCNFKLRDNESFKDAEFTEELAASLNVPFYSVDFETDEYASSHHISVQMAARDLRYEWLNRVRTNFNFHYIATAHHQNDVIETMLLNLTRGTGIAGMHGILPKKTHIIRPLLFLKRDDIDLLCTNMKVAYREDSSNLSAKYARNKIRLEVIPVLKSLNPSLEKTFEENRKRFEELEIILAQRVATVKKQLFIETGTDTYELSLDGLKGLQPADTLLFELFSPFGFSQPVLKDLQNSWGGEPGKVFRSASHELHLDRGKLELRKISFDDEKPLLVESNPGDFKWSGKLYRSVCFPGENYRLQMQVNVAELDWDLLQFPLTLRKWKNGDHFQPLGLRGSKKLSDFFIAEKVPRSRKNEVGVLQNGNGDIVWIAGYRIHEGYKITANTKKVFIFEQFA